MKNYPQIISRVYREPWCILPTVHQAIRRVLASRLEGEPGEVGIATAPEELETSVGAASIVPVFGILGKHLSMIEMLCGGCDIDTVRRDLEAAVEDGNTDRVILYFNSPGGVYTGIPELARFIREADASKPVYAYTDSCMCSGAYWLASSARMIIVSPSSTVGSVGVYSVYLDETEALSMEGYKVNAISAGKLKLMGASFKEMTKEERAILQTEADRIHAEFRAAVTIRGPIADDDMEGDTYSGDQAVAIDMADATADTLEDAVTLTSQLLVSEET